MGSVEGRRCPGGVRLRVSDRRRGTNADVRGVYSSQAGAELLGCFAFLAASWARVDIDQHAVDDAMRHRTFVAPYRHRISGQLDSGPGSRLQVAMASSNSVASIQCRRCTQSLRSSLICVGGRRIRCSRWCPVCVARSATRVGWAPVRLRRSARSSWCDRLRRGHGDGAFRIAGCDDV